MKIDSIVTTDDGSAGLKGFVTKALEKLLNESNLAPAKTIIYSCGPEPMLEAVAKIAEKFNIECQVSMERVMACGIGLCQGCAVECKTDDPQKTIYKMCCSDGPVFDSKEVIFKK